MAEMEMYDMIQQHPQPQEDAPPPQEDGPPPHTNAPLPQEDGPPPQVAAPPLPRLPRYPNQDLLGNDRRRDFIRICVPLYNALMIGDWGAAYGFLDAHENLKRSSITDNLETALHVVASAQNNMERVDHFVQILVNTMEPADLLLQNRDGNTALSLVATSGNVNIARIMVNKNRMLPTIRNNDDMLPLYIAVLHKNLAMKDFLYGESEQMRGLGWRDEDKSWVFLKAVEADLFDFALKILEDHRLLANDRRALYALARNPSAFNEIEPNLFRKIVNSIFYFKMNTVIAMDSKAVKILRKIWELIEGNTKAKIDEILRGPKETIYRIETHPSRVLFVAVEMGNTMFLAELIHRYPDLIWKKNDDGLSIFHVAVSHLHENIYNLLYEIGRPMRALIIAIKDKDDNNMLHMVGKKPEKSQLQGVSGVAFQMQRKLQWFQEVKSMIPPYRDRKNKSGFTPLELFTENHKDLVSEAEKWMEGTASKCLIVSALLATVAFGIAYKIPGGYEQNNNKKEGLPVFLHNPAFLIFVMLVSSSLILSSISILVFLSILTSRYAQEDFLETLPRRLLLGLVLLFFSIVSMMISFSVSFYVVYHGKLMVMTILITLGALIPSAMYLVLQFPLLKDVFRSLYSSGYLFKPKKQMLYYQNPRF